LDAVNRGLIHTAANLSPLQNIVDTNGLYSEYWLLIYEAVKKGWLFDTNSLITRDPIFSFLSNNSVAFYNTANSLPAIATITITPGGGGGGGGGGILATY
jgi:hypothetical protein